MLTKIIQGHTAPILSGNQRTLDTIITKHLSDFQTALHESIMFAEKLFSQLIEIFYTPNDERETMAGLMEDINTYFTKMQQEGNAFAKALIQSDKQVTVYYDVLFKDFIATHDNILQTDYTCEENPEVFNILLKTSLTQAFTYSFIGMIEAINEVMSPMRAKFATQELINTWPPFSQLLSNHTVEET